MQIILPVVSIRPIVAEAVIASVDQYARRKSAAGQLGLFENPSEKQRPLFSKKIDESKGRWLTMRGTHVFVEGDSDGKERIVKGPKEFVGKTPSEMKEMQSAGSSKPKPLNELGKIQGKKKQDQRGLFGGKDVRSLFREGIEKHFEKMNAPKESANKPTSESSRPLDESFEENEGPLNGSIVDSEDAGWSDEEIIASCIDAKWSGKKIFNECKSAEWTDSQIVEAMENAGSDDKEIAALLDESGMPDRDLFNALDSAGWNDIRIEDACSAAGFSVARVKSILGDESESPEEPSEQAGPVEDALKSSFESALGKSQGEAPSSSPDESEPFALSPPPKPSPKKQDFGNNEKSKQGGLFDAGKKGELKGQELLFNKDFADKFEKENGKEPKRDKYSRIQVIQQSLSVREVVRLEIDRYSRLPVQFGKPSTSGRSVAPDQYAHPLVHAAVHAGLHAAVNATFRPGGLGKKLAHGLVAGAMAAWMAHAQASANQAAQNQVAQAAAQTQNQPRPTGAQLVANVVNNHLAARQAAKQQATQTAAPAAPAAGSPKPVRPLGGTSMPPVSASTSAASSSPVTTTPGTGKRPLREPASSPDGIKRETTFHDGKRPGEFAPKDGGAGGAGGAVASDKSDESPESNSPRNYPDNLNKPASEQTPYSPPDRSIGGGEPAESDYEQKQKQDSNLQAAIKAHMDKILAGKSPARPNPRKAVREGRSDVPLQPISAKSPEEIKAEKKAEKQAEKQAIERIAFNPDELEAESSKMIDDNLADPGEKPKESDFQSSYKYEKAVQDHNRRAGAREAAIKRRAGKSVIPDVANEHDLDHDELRQAVDQEVQMLMPTYNRENEARQYISDMGWHSGRINRAEDSGRDHSRTNLDENASEWAGLFPEIAGPDESQWVDRMWELSKRGKQPAPSGNDEELVNRVAKRLASEREWAKGSGGYPASGDFGNPHSFPDVGPVQNEYGETVPFSRFNSRSGLKTRVIVDRYVRRLLSEYSEHSV